jgi:hypothetical protein
MSRAEEHQPSEVTTTGCFASAEDAEAFLTTSRKRDAASAPTLPPESGSVLFFLALRDLFFSSKGADLESSRQMGQESSAKENYWHRENEIHEGHPKEGQERVQKWNCPQAQGQESHLNNARGWP